jgi:hypothetical protein
MFFSNLFQARHRSKKAPKNIKKKKLRKLRAFSLSSVMMTRHLLSALLAKVLATQQKNKGGGDFSLPPFLPTKRKKKKKKRCARSEENAIGYRVRGIKENRAHALNRGKNRNGPGLRLVCV